MDSNKDLNLILKSLLRNQKILQKILILKQLERQHI